MAVKVEDFLQSFRAAKKGLEADKPQPISSETKAVEEATKLAEHKAGVIAFSVVSDVKADIWGEPEIFFRAGRLPPELQA